MKHIFKLTALATAIVLAGCSDDSATPKTTEGEPGAQTTAAEAKLFETREASAEQCANGGEVIDMGIDSNGNNKLDASEITASQLICNGSNGADGDNGLTPLVLITPADAAACASGGSVITTGIDQNADGKLTEDEAPATATLCNGADGQNGANGQDGNDGQDGTNGQDGVDGTNGQDGAPGKDGLTPLIKVETIAAGNVCPNGGQKVTSGIDADADGTIDPETAAQAVICNGVDANNLLSVSDVVVVEGEAANFTLTLAQAQSVDTTFFVTTQNSNAVAGTDYELTVAEVTIAAGQTSGQFPVTTLADTRFENPEYFTLQVSGAGAQATGVAKITQPEFTAALQTAATNTAIGSNIVIELSDDVADIASDAIQVVSQAGTVVDGVAEYAKQGNVTPILRFTPSASLALNTTYTVSTNPVTTTGLNQEKTIANVEFTTEDQAFAYRSVPAESLNSSSALWQWLANGTAREIKSVNDPLTFASEGIDYNGLHYFAGSVVADATSQLYVTDGSSHGTKVLTDAEGIALVNNPNNFTLFNGKLYFTANNAGDTLQQLWTTDGTVEGTVAIANTEAEAISELTVVGEALYFTVGNDTTRDLYAFHAVDGVKVISSAVTFPQNLIAVSDQLYFITELTNLVGRELYTYLNGEIVLALNLNTDNFGSSAFKNLQVINNQLFFTAEPTGGARFAYLYDGVNAPLKVANTDNIILPTTAQFGTEVFYLTRSGDSKLRVTNSADIVATFNSTNGLITTPAGVVVVGEMTVDSVATTGLWLFTDATAPAAPVITVEAGTVALEGLVGDQLLYSVTVNAVTEYFLTDLVSKSETGETVVTPVTNELGAL